MSTRSVTSVLIVLIERSEKALAFGARIGVLMTRAPSVLNISSKDRANLASRSRIRNRMSSNSPVMERFLACWVQKTPSGFDVAKEKRSLREPTSMKAST